MEELSYLEKSKLAHSLLLDPETGRAAAYTSNHSLVVAEASKKLVAYALANTHKVAPFDAKEHAKGLPDWYPLPEWATPEVQGRMKLVWIERPDSEDLDGWLAFPKR